MIEKVKVISQIEVVESGHIQVRESLKLVEDGVVLSEKYHRYVLEPGQSLDGQPADVVAIAAAVWTPEKIAKHEDSKANNSLGV